MKKIIVAFAMLASMSAGAQVVADPWSVASIALTIGQWITKDSKKVYYVQVEATAPTSEQARQSAFRKAVELAVGQVVLGESETDGKRVVRNDIITYSSGYVDDYKIINETRIGDRTRMTVDVWVSNSRIAERLTAIGSNSGASIDGSAIKNQWQTDQAREKTDSERRSNGMRMMNAIVADYPQLAIQPTVKRTWVGKSNGNTAFFVTVDLQFSRKWIEAADEAIDLTRHSKVGGYGRTGVSLHYGVLNMSGANGYYNDGAVRSMFDSAFAKPANTKLTFLGNGKPYVNCWVKTDDFISGKLFGYFANNDQMLVIKGGTTVSHTYILENLPKWGWSDDKFIGWVSGFNRVEAQVVDTSSCP